MKKLDLLIEGCDKCPESHYHGEDDEYYCYANNDVKKIKDWADKDFIIADWCPLPEASKEDIDRKAIEAIKASMGYETKKT